MAKQRGNDRASEPIKRVTGTMVQILNVLERSDQPITGADIIKATGFLSGTVYPLLAKMDTAGWITIKQENGDPRVLQRPLKNFIRITAKGRAVGHRERSKYLLNPNSSTSNRNTL